MVDIIRLKMLSQSLRHFSKRSTMYPCVPGHQVVVKADPFDYKLRSRAEVIQEHKYWMPDVEASAMYKKYTAGDVR